jgi:hypothetical protein
MQRSKQEIINLVAAGLVSLSALLGAIAAERSGQLRGSLGDQATALRAIIWTVIGRYTDANGDEYQFYQRQHTPTPPRARDREPAHV